jgi:hypothetical protein
LRGERGLRGFQKRLHYKNPEDLPQRHGVTEFSFSLLGVSVSLWFDFRQLKAAGKYRLSLFISALNFNCAAYQRLSGYTTIFPISLK